MGIWLSMLEHDRLGTSLDLELLRFNFSFLFFSGKAVSPNDGLRSVFNMISCFLKSTAGLSTDSSGPCFVQRVVSFAGLPSDTKVSPRDELDLSRDGVPSQTTRGAGADAGGAGGLLLSRFRRFFVFFTSVGALWASTTVLLDSP